MRKTLCYALIIGAACCTTSPTRGADKTSPPTAASPTETARELVRHCADYYKRLASLEVRCDWHERTVGADGKLSENKSSTTIAAERPNRVALRSNWGDFGYGLICDGKQAFSYHEFPVPQAIAGAGPVPTQAKVPQQNQPTPEYMEEVAPGSLQELTESPIIASASAGLWANLPFALRLLADDPGASLLEEVNSLTYIGREQLDGIPTHRIRFADDLGITWDVWIAADGDPVVKQVTVDLKSLTGIYIPPIPTSWTITQKYTEWKLNRPAARDAFVFTPAHGSQKVADLFAVPMECPLLGKKCPNLAIKLLDGGTMRLEKHLHREIVVIVSQLDLANPFLRPLLNALDQLAKQYRDRQVVIYAVNNEFDSTIELRKALARQAVDAYRKKHQMPLDVLVAIDEVKQIWRTFCGEDLIGSAVVIDKEGIVRACEASGIPGLKRRLKRDLDAVLAGK
jgi:hypothetical protein